MVIIQEENLKNEETHVFINNSFRDGSLRTSGIDIDAILPPVSRFGSAGAGRAEKRKRVMEEKHCDSLKNIFYTSKREEWRKWLSKNYRTAKEVWFVFPMKETGEESLSYNDAVEEALCFGWIDSTIKHIDKTHRAQHFTPRKKGSAYSRPNIERLIWLEKNNLLMEEIRLEVLELIRAPYVFPDDIISSIKTDLRVWENFNSLSDGYKRIRIAYIDAARKRPEEFKKRLENFIAKTHDGKIIKGFGGIEKYY